MRKTITLRLICNAALRLYVLQQSRVIFFASNFFLKSRITSAKDPLRKRNKNDYTKSGGACGAIYCVGSSLSPPILSFLCERRHLNIFSKIFQSKLL